MKRDNGGERRKVLRENTDGNDAVYQGKKTERKTS